MRLYTRTGDDGTTGLFGGGRLSKDHPRMHAIGSVDEVNAAIGLAASASTLDLFAPIFRRLQSGLFDVGADLATPHDSKHESRIMRINADHIAQIESIIDQVDAGNTPMKNFVLPGGTELAARLHLARAVCRRAERDIVSLSKAESMNPQTIIFINRVSDLLFAMARRANKESGVADVPWIASAPADQRSRSGHGSGQRKKNAAE